LLFFQEDCLCSFSMEIAQIRRTAHIDLTWLFRRASGVSGGVVLLIGLVVLMGWWLDIPLLRGSFTTSLTPMSLRSAITFVAGGLSLLSLHRWSRSRIAQVSSQVLAVVVLLLGFLELGKTGLHWPVEQWFAPVLRHSWSEIATSQVALGTGLNSVLIGNALLLSSRSEYWVRRLAQLCTLITTLVAVNALLNNVHPIGLVSAHPVPPMALLTALTFLLLGAGIQAFHFDESIIQVVRISEGPSEKLVCQLFLAAIALSLIEVVVTLWQSPPTTGEAVFDLSLLTIKTVFIFSLLVGWSISLLTQIRQDYQQAEAAVDESLIWFQLAQAAASVGRWRWHIATNQMRWCGLQEQIFGITPGSFGGTWAAFIDCVHPDDRATVEQVLTQAIANQQDYVDQFRIVWPDSSTHWILSKGRCFCDASGRVIGLSGVSLDISEYRKLEAERDQLLQLEQAARLRAEAANRMKDEFLSILSHEVRTPLNSVLGWAHLLRSRSLDPVVIEKGLEALERNAQAQAQIIEDLLDMARVVQGKLQLQLQPTNLSTVVEEAMSVIRPAAAAKRIQIESNIDCNLNYFMGDAARLQQIVWNLLSNAVKFTPLGGRICVTLAQNETEVQITVSDTGRGISPEFLPYVFDRFRQEDSTITRHYGGLGLGLALTRYLVELHGGVVEATSQGLGKGATFTIKLPMRQF
jgi:signal transduction histidine kinase